MIYIKLFIYNMYDIYIYTYMIYIYIYDMYDIYIYIDMYDILCVTYEV